MRNSTAFLRALCILCAAGLLATGCTDTEETREMDFSLSRYSVAFSVEGGTTTVSVGTSDSWDATADATWLSLSRDGSTLYITAAANDQTDAIRESDVTVTTSLYGSAVIQVRQEPAEAASITITYGSAAHTIDSEGGSFTVAVKSNYDWTASLSGGSEGWTFDADAAAGIISIKAGANSGDAVTGTVTVTAGTGNVTASEQFTVTQLSRADNPYYQFVGLWNVSAADCYTGGSWAGTQGTYTTCSLLEYDYYGELLSFANWSTEGLQCDKLQYNGDERKATLPMGYLAGSMKLSNGITYYMYFVSFDEAFTNFSTASNLVLNLSDDGTSIEVSGISEDYPIIGWVAYNAYMGYSIVSDLAYCRIPVTFSKSEGESTSSIGSDIVSFSPATEIPEGVPARLPKGMTAGVSGTLSF